MQTMGRTPKPKGVMGKRLAAIREKLGLTQAEAAEKVCMSRANWHSIETGKTKPTKAHLKLIEFLEEGKL